MKCHHPDVFLAAILNAQPMGFYAPAQLVRDARDHGVEVRPVSVAASRWDCTLEPTEGRFLAVRLGCGWSRAWPTKTAPALSCSARMCRTAASRTCGAGREVPAAALERLAEADAFLGLGLDRRQAWEFRGLADDGAAAVRRCRSRGTAPAGSRRAAGQAGTRRPKAAKSSRTTTASASLSRRHPLAFLRRELARRKLVPAPPVGALKDGSRVAVAGIVLVRQRPGSARGVLFVTLEDETSVANLVIWSTVFENHRRIVLNAEMLACHGRLQREGDVIHVIAERCEDLSGLLRGVGARDGDDAAGIIKVATRDFRSGRCSGSASLCSDPGDSARRTALPWLRRGL